MFTGIIEDAGEITRIDKEGSNIHLTVSSAITSELKIDQSVAHNGVCLTVVKIDGDNYVVTAIDETLKRSNIGDLTVGDRVNLERCTKIGSRLDGHIVQGHVDQTARCTSVREVDGSWEFRFEFESKPSHVMVEKGSVTINGVSLTVVDVSDNGFSVAIIPYTFEHTNFNELKPSDKVNIEFDIVGKYVEKLVGERKA